MKLMYSSGVIGNQKCGAADDDDYDDYDDDTGVTLTWIT